MIPRWCDVIRRKALRFFLLFAALDLLAGCDSPTDLDSALESPPNTGDGWQTATLQSVGMDPKPVRNLLRLIGSTEDHGIHSLLIVKDQRLVVEEYWPGTDLNPVGLSPVAKDFDRETLHYVASVSKSMTSILAGVALDQGLIQSVDDLVFDYYTDHQELETEANAPITLRHLLSFSSGFHWNEFVYGFDDPRDSHHLMFAAVDPIEHLLGRPMDTAPGAEWHYNSGDTNLLGEIIRRASGSPTLLDFAEEFLFDPLGIDSFQWTRFGSAPHVAFASGGASLRPRDMAKIGALFLDGGVWNGLRIVSEDWVNESTAMAVPLQGNYRTLYGYGYNWWLGRSPFRGGTVEYFMAMGWGGQTILVFPDLEMVVVFTGGGFYESLPLSVDDIMEDYLFPSIED
jgi:CubicO group peptidase (beta-lactamase class C family)